MTVLVDAVAEALKTRTKQFVVAVLGFIESLPRTPAGDLLARQLSRSGAGVAGNYRSACRARSHAEFVARIGIVLEEADESELWFEVAEARGMGDAPARARLLDESSQLRAIFAKAYATARARHGTRS